VTLLIRTIARATDRIVERTMTGQVEETVTPQTDGASWRDHLLESPAQIKDLLENTHRIAVLGIKPDPDQPAYYVPEYAERAGYEIIPVPVYYKELTEIMGKKVYRKIADVPGEVDMVNVFRLPNDIPPHVDDIIAKNPKSVWFQLGIRNDGAAEKLARAGIDVVQDHCLLVELRRIGR
jgi:predicted CoA-binding protein